MKFSVDRLRLAIAKSMKNQIQLAEESDVSAITISGILNGSNPSLPTIGKLAKALGIAVEDLFDYDSDDPSVTPEERKALGL